MLDTERMKTFFEGSLWPASCLLRRPFEVVFDGFARRYDDHADAVKQWLIYSAVVYAAVRYGRSFYLLYLQDTQDVIFLGVFTFILPLFRAATLLILHMQISQMYQSTKPSPLASAAPALILLLSGLLCVVFTISIPVSFVHFLADPSSQIDELATIASNLVYLAGMLAATDDGERPVKEVSFAGAGA